MGLVQKVPNVFHFSHPHPLECTTSPSTGNITCFGCKLSVAYGEDYYSCKSCAFSLHYVCNKMPLITNHPSHPRHDLVLLVIPSSPSTNSTLNNCMACGKHVMGFCYHCAECSIFFHALCLALPLSLAIAYHPHKIKLKFSAPYDFFCDLCNKPSYNNGWLYRCSMCEFDTHIACAVKNLEPQLFRNPSFPQSNGFFRGSVGDSNTRYDYEVMRLMAQHVGWRISKSTGQEDFDSARKKHNINSGKTKIVELSPADSLANLEERTPLRDTLTSLSDQTSTPTSHQFSDSYFSIDLAKPYSTHHDHKSQVREEISSDQLITQIVMPERIVSNSEQAEESFGIVNWLSNDSYNGGRASDFGESSQKVVMKNPNQSLAKWSIKDQKMITKSESERYRSCGWRKFLTCCL